MSLAHFQQAALRLEIATGDKSELVRAWHQSVDARDGFSPLSEREYERQRAALQREVHIRDEELRLRPLRREAALAQAKLEAAGG